MLQASQGASQEPVQQINDNLTYFVGGLDVIIIITGNGTTQWKEWCCDCCNFHTRVVIQIFISFRLFAWTFSAHFSLIESCFSFWVRVSSVSSDHRLYTVYNLSSMQCVVQFGTVDLVSWITSYPAMIICRRRYLLSARKFRDVQSFPGKEENYTNLV